MPKSSLSWNLLKRIDDSAGSAGVTAFAGLAKRISKPEIIEYALMRFQEQLQMCLRELQEQTLKAAGAVTDLQNRRRELKGQAQNLGVAIAKMGHSATLIQIGPN